MEPWPCLFLFLEVFSSTVLSYPSGKIDMACNSMLPMHGTSAPQTSPPLYAISVSSMAFNPGDEITVSLTAMNDSSFKGFLLQAREIGGDVAVGTFRILTPDTQGLVCNNIQCECCLSSDDNFQSFTVCFGFIFFLFIGYYISLFFLIYINSRNSSVSHTDRRNKQNVSAVWVAPPGLKHVIFRATVLHNFTVFWAQVQSQILVSSSPPVSDLPSFPQSSRPSLTMSSKEVCGAQKFCFSSLAGCDPHDPNCYFMSSEALESGGFKFEISGLSDGYVAIGFSDDTTMGNDDIYICGRNASDHIEVQRAYSTGYTTPSIKPLGKVEILETSFNNGIIGCSFISRNAISIQSRAGDSLYYVILAYGPSSAGQILKHLRTPIMTEERVNLSSFATQGGSWSTPLIIKAHGALMLVAWMTTGSIGMVFARYLKSIKKPLLGKDIWFQIHFWMMLLTVAATITAFVLAFVASKGWSSWAQTHAIIGCIVMILSFFQPLIAFFRPSPQNNRRFIFNWFHMLNALVIKVLADADLFLGLKMLSSPDHWMVKTMGGFVGWEALIAITLDVNLWLKKREIYDDSQAKMKSEVLLLLIYLCGSLAFVIALLVGIGKS